MWELDMYHILIKLLVISVARQTNEVTVVTVGIEIMPLYCEQWTWVDGGMFQALYFKILCFKLLNSRDV